jgi:iron complex transport system ATP-binding protein
MTWDAEHLPQSLQLDRLALRAGGTGHGRLLVSELTLHAAPGQRWVLLGPNGAGKSTLLMAIAGLIAPDAGSIVLGERSIADWRSEALARRRAWCPQFWLDPFPVSAWETVACAVLATQPQRDAAAVEQHARYWLQCFDAGLLADHDVRTLSGGERQRVALATAFAQGAPLLLLDEPSSHLDWAHQRLLQRLLKQWSADNGTALVAVHDLNLAWALATHAILLDGKGGAVCGPRDRVLTASAIGAAYGVSVSLTDDGDARWFRVNMEPHEGDEGDE